MVFSKVVQEEIPIPSSFVKLSYLSSRTPGYKTLLRIILTHTTIPPGMTKVHLIVAVEGRLLQKWFPAAANLVYTFAWNKTDIYGQKVSGLAEAMGTYKHLDVSRSAHTRQVREKGLTKFVAALRFF